jgi:hypothetical protein
MKINIFILSLTCVVVLTSIFSAQRLKNSPNRDSWDFLLDNWLGEDGDNPGQVVGNFSYNIDLQKIILESNGLF